MYAIVEISGKQYKAEAGKKIYVDLIQAESGQKMSFDRVLLVDNNGSVQVGAPTTGNTVNATVVKHVRADKVIVFKKKRRKGYKVKNGHRQPYTQISVDSIS
ncbi:MAG: 50S ribosomal protein L21 [Bacteroidetes bacterium]|nr:50S ribosomal protein L21 [Bacteroidota bacterium]